MDERHGLSAIDARLPVAGKASRGRTRPRASGPGRPNAPCSEDEPTPSLTAHHDAEHRPGPDIAALLWIPNAADSIVRVEVEPWPRTADPHAEPTPPDRRRDGAGAGGGKHGGAGGLRIR